MKAIFKYPGSKWSIADWIISYFPPHHSYLELFAGSLAVLFNKPRSNIETVNDLDNNVVNLFEWIKKDPERLAHAIYFTPYARQICDNTYGQEPKDTFDKALNFYIRLNMGYGFRTNGEKVGWKNDIQGRGRAYAAEDWREQPERIIEVAERLRGVQIENQPALKLMKRFNYKNVLIYMDPPYLLNTRHGKQYRHEMQTEDHIELLELAKLHKGPALISGYDSDLYNEILKGWNREEITSRDQRENARKEILWMNYEPPAKQMSLFEQEEKK